MTSSLPRTRSHAKARHDSACQPSQRQVFVSKESGGCAKRDREVIPQYPLRFDRLARLHPCCQQPLTHAVPLGIGRRKSQNTQVSELWGLESQGFRPWRISLRNNQKNPTNGSGKRPEGIRQKTRWSDHGECWVWMPAGTDSRRVPQAVRAARPRPTQRFCLHPNDDAMTQSLCCLELIAQGGHVSCRTIALRLRRYRCSFQKVGSATLSQRVFARAARTTRANRACRRTPPAHQVDARCQHVPAEYGWHR